VDYHDSFYLLSTEAVTLPYEHSNLKAYYLQLMRGVSGKIDVEKLVYVCSENSDYTYFRDEMLKSIPTALNECTVYRQ
jgi:hypothetical protein